MEVVANGRRLFAANGGHAARQDEPALVFLHGAGADHSVWTPQARYFAHHGFAVIGVDLPGHGRSTGPPCATIEDMADTVIAAIDALDHEEATLVGHSMGALVALEAAARAPHRVSRLALLGGGVPMRVSPALLAAAAQDVRAAAAMMVGWGYGASARIGGHPSPGLWMTGGGARLIERAPAGTLQADLVGCDRYQSGLASAAGLDCPILLLCGAEDRMINRGAAAALAEALPGATTMSLDCGHFMMSEQPDAVLDALREFLAAYAG